MRKTVINLAILTGIAGLAFGIYFKVATSPDRILSMAIITIVAYVGIFAVSLLNLLKNAKAFFKKAKTLEFFIGFCLSVIHFLFVLFSVGLVKTMVTLPRVPSTGSLIATGALDEGSNYSLPSGTIFFLMVFSVILLGFAGLLISGTLYSGPMPYEEEEEQAERRNLKKKRRMDEDYLDEDYADEMYDEDGYLIENDKAPKTKRKRKGAKKKSIRGRIIAVLLLIAIILGAALAWKLFYSEKPGQVDLTAGIVLEYSGQDGSGKAKVKENKVSYTSSDSEVKDFFEKDLSYKIDKDKNLKNGDKITVEVKYPKAKALKLKLDLIHEKKEYIVSGLKDKEDDNSSEDKKTKDDGRYHSTSEVSQGVRQKWRNEATKIIKQHTSEIVSNPYYTFVREYLAISGTNNNDCYVALYSFKGRDNSGKGSSGYAVVNLINFNKKNKLAATDVAAVPLEKNNKYITDRSEAINALTAAYKKDGYTLYPF